MESGSPLRGCLDLALLDAIATGREDASASVHLRECERCRALLEEMRSANRFLRRFQSHEETEATHTSDPGSVRVQGYQIQSFVAFGGQGAVYRATQNGTGRTVAIKVPLADTQLRPSSRYRLEREIELTARLDHPGIVRVIGPCEFADGRVGCVMEFIEGEPFERWASGCRKEGRGAVRRIVEAGAKVADAIAYAHQRAVLHRDIKPSNVIVTAEGEPHVLDFGLAKALGDNSGSFATLTGVFVGTLIHSAPEQVSEGAEAIDMRTDVYSLGLLLYQALTGRLPYPSDVSTAEILRMIKKLPPPRPSSLADDIDNDLDAVLLCALAKEKDRRYASASELRDDLLAWLDGRAVRARFDSQWYVLRKTIRRHKWPVMLVAAVLAVVATTATLGLVAREQSSRAKIAGAVRDARTLESHWASMAEARSIGRDNFEAGEVIAWDALLEPDRVLVTQDIEGLTGTSGAPTSPSFWALWEMYLRTPLVYTAPVTSKPWVAYDSNADAMVCGDWSRGEIQWWDWRQESQIRSISVPDLSELIVFCISPDARWAQFSTARWRSFLISLGTGHYLELEEGLHSVGGGVANTRMATFIRMTEGGWEWRLWAIDQGPKKLLASYSVETRIENSIFDASGRFAALITSQGDVMVIDAETGELIYQKDGEVEPRFLKIMTRGNPGEFVLTGPGRLSTFDARDPSSGLKVTDIRATFADGHRSHSGAADADRFVVVSDRWRVGVGKRSDPPSKGIALPALIADQLSLTRDGRFAIGLARPSGRPFVLDLDINGITRLPMPSSITKMGFPTIFGLAFSPDSRQLWVGAMDGSVRCFGVGTRSMSIGDPIRLESGITTLQASGNELYVGTHDLGLSTAGVYRLSDGVTQTLIPDQHRWISATLIDGESRLWALTGMGQLMLSDSRTGAQIRETQLLSHADIFTFRALARLPGRRILLAGPAEEGVVLLDEDTLDPVGPSVAMPPIREFAVSPSDPDLIAVAGDDGKITLWRFEADPTPTLRQISQFGTHAGGIYTLAFSPDGKLLATGGGTPESSDVRLWDVAHGRELVSLDLFELGVMELAFSPDGRWLAVGGEVELKNPEAGGQLFLIDLEAPARCVAGNLEYHIARLTEELGREPSQAAALRKWANGVRKPADSNETSP